MAAHCGRCGGNVTKGRKHHNFAPATQLWTYTCPNLRGKSAARRAEEEASRAEERKRAADLRGWNREAPKIKIVIDRMPRNWDCDWCGEKGNIADDTTCWKRNCNRAAPWLR